MHFEGYDQLFTHLFHVLFVGSYVRGVIGVKSNLLWIAYYVRLSQIDCNSDSEASVSGNGEEDL